jgi:hypothetical protein
MQFKKEGLKLQSCCKKMQPEEDYFPQSGLHFLAHTDSLFLAETFFNSAALLF